ncbi:MAG: hypothetical protein NC489_19380 [Ruminococcus flavefaciens]|nr:hypothetical protein [Ruminococcus flavefaciens]
MNRIAEFKKVSFRQFLSGCTNTFKTGSYRMQLDNSVGVVDSDYFNSSNEGHIFAQFTNDSKNGKILEIKRGDGFMQGLFTPYGIVVDDNVTAVRNGGFGSTGR